jgi:hypothetical protein
MNMRRLISTGLATLALLTAALLLGSAPAFAIIGHVLLPTSLGPFEGPTNVAVDNSTSVSDPSAGDVYVAAGDANSRNGAVFKFDSAGNPVPDGPLGSFAFTSSPNEGIKVTLLAVDPTTGDLYVADKGTNTVYKFDPSGNPISTGNFPLEVPGVGSLTIDPSDGELFVNSPGIGIIFEYDSAGTPLGSFSPGLSVGRTLVDIAANTDGETYGSSYSFGGGHITLFHATVLKFSAGGASSSPVKEFEVELPTSTSIPMGIAVDPATNGLYSYDALTGGIDEYDSAGSLFYSFDVGQFRGAESLAVGDGTSGGDVYVADDHNMVDIFAPTVLPDVVVGAPTNVLPESITVTGTVDADALHGGGDVGSIQVEYGVTRQYGSTVEGTPSECPASAASCSVGGNLTGLEANTTYHYRLGATNSNGTNQSEDQEFRTPPGPPTLSTVSAEDVTPFRATLISTVNPENAPSGTTTYHYVWVDDAHYAASASNPYSAGSVSQPDINAGDGSGWIPAVDTLEKLTPGTLYHYALVATNPTTGTTVSPDATFLTPPAAPPAVSTGAASAVAQYTATIAGTLDTQGLTTSYHFDLGADTNYGAQIFGSPALFSGPTPVTLDLQNLQPGTTYHYRLTATNAAGTTYGADETFTTPGIPLVISQPGTEPLIGVPNISFPAAAKGTVGKAPTRAERLRKALKRCKKDHSKSKRSHCEKAAKKRFGPLRKTPR